MNPPRMIPVVFYRTRGGAELVRDWLRSLPSNRIARVLFCVVRNRVVVLHGFIKKTQKTPDDELALARKRKKEFDA